MPLGNPIGRDTELGWTYRQVGETYMGSTWGERTDILKISGVSVRTSEKWVHLFFYVGHVVGSRYIGGNGPKCRLCPAKVGRWFDPLGFEGLVEL